jgi:DNA replication protein DnaC
MGTKALCLVDDAVVTAEFALQDNLLRVETPPSISPGSCGTCNGTGWEFIESKGVRPCNCRKAGLRLKLINGARIPERYKNCSLQNYEPAQGNISQMRAINFAHRLVHDYPAVERGLLFTGSVGVGKTHLAVGILRGLMEKGIPCMFWEYGPLLKTIQASYNKASQASEMDILEPVFQTDVLLLDELGALKPSEWVLDMIRFIIGTRYSENRLTIVTTNYADAITGSGEDLLEDRIGARLRSRLFQMCKTVAIDGEDYRRRFDAGSFGSLEHS